MTQFKLINILRNNWIDGYCYNGKYCNEKTINYVSKYMTKKDEDNPEYTGKVLCSPGLGAGYIKRIGERRKWKGKETKEDYYTKQGTLTIPRENKKGNREKHETLVRHRKRTYQYTEGTTGANLTEAEADAQKAVAEWNSAMTKAEVDQATKETAIQTMKQNLINMQAELSPSLLF